MQFLHTCLRVADLERALRFYRLLGFEERQRFVVRQTEVHVYVATETDTVRFELVEDPSLPDPGAERRYDHSALGVDDLDVALTHLGAHGIEAEAPPFIGATGSRICFIHDPDGYRIELVQQPAP